MRDSHIVYLGERAIITVVGTEKQEHLLHILSETMLGPPPWESAQCRAQVRASEVREVEAAVDPLFFPDAYCRDDEVPGHSARDVEKPCRILATQEHGHRIQRMAKELCR